MKKLLIKLETNNLILYRISGDEITESSPVSIGRSHSCKWNLPADDKTASMNHAQIFRKKKDLFIKDTNSHNGVLFEENRISERKLRPGEHYTIGSAILTVGEEHTKAQTVYAPHHRLKQLNGKEKNRSFDLDKEETTVGSDPASGLCLSVPYISRVHAKVIVKPDNSCWLIAFPSTNGTKVNGQRLSPEVEGGRMLQHYDEISFASLKFVFYDKNRPPHESHFWAKTAISVLTAVIVLSLYHLYTIVYPDATIFMENARQLAAVCQWKQATDELDKARNARLAQHYENEISTLKSHIGIWKKTVQDWNEIRALLRKRQWITAATRLGPLTTADINWQWNNEDGSKQKTVARKTHSALVVMLRAREAFTMPETPPEKLREEQAVFTPMVVMLKQDSENYPAVLADSAEDILNELTTVLDNLGTMDALLEKLTPESDLPALIRETDKIRKAAAARIDERIKRSKKYSVHVQEKANYILAPLTLLSVAQRAVSQNLQTVSKLDFRNTLKTLQLPRTDQVAKDPLLSGKVHLISTELTKRQQALTVIYKQLEQLCGSIDALDGKLPALPELERIAEPAFFTRLCNCPDFGDETALRRWAKERVNRKTPLGSYDEVLGWEFFWEILNEIAMLDGDARPGMPDAAACLMDKPFTPTIMMIRRKLNDLMLFADYAHGVNATGAVHKKLLIDLSTLALPDGGNRFKVLVEHVDGLLASYRRFLEQAISAARTAAAAEPVNERAVVIAAGMTLLLEKPSPIVFQRSDYHLVAVSLKAMRTACDVLVKKGGSLEEINRHYREVIARGLPGDPNVARSIRELYLK